MVTKKFKLGVKKCKKMHIGRDDWTCTNLKVPDKEKISSEQEKYLGDIITSDTMIDENICMRHECSY